jgi:hypothetical protein
MKILLLKQMIIMNGKFQLGHIIVGQILKEITPKKM